LDEIVVYLDELGEFASFAGTKLHVLSVMYGSISTRRGTLFYDFVYSMLEWSIERGCDTMMVQILNEKEKLVAKIMFDEKTEGFEIDNGFMTAVGTAGGCISVKDMDDVMGVWLSFPEGGDAYA
jgi:hypothetical protein